MLIINNKALKITNKWLNPIAGSGPTPGPTPPGPIDPYNPLDLPANTVRVRTSDGNAPIKGGSTSYETATLVAGTSDVYDVYKSGDNFQYLFYLSTNIVEVLGANTTGITDMYGMFFGCNAITTVPLFDTTIVTDMRRMFNDCSAITTVPLFDTTNVTNMYYMLTSCSALTTVPLFNTSKVTNVGGMLWGCTNVQSGALALYNQLSSQTTPPSTHDKAFRNCGSNTTTGAAELAQIPSDWK